MADHPSFIDTQLQFAQHIRDPEQPPPAGIEDRRLAIYRDLFYNNIEGFIANGFPVIKSLLDDATWHREIRRFMTHYQAESPYFAEVSKEFVNYVRTGASLLTEEYPFIEELAHYEWVELALMIDPVDIAQIATEDSVDLLNQPLIISPVAWPLAYHYDVHHIGQEYIPHQPPAQPTFLVVYRNRTDDVEFTEINGVTYTLLEIMKQYQKETGLQILQRLAESMPSVPEQSILDHGLDIMMKLMKRDVILGVSA